MSAYYARDYPAALLPWIAAGATLALAITATSFALIGRHELDGLQQRCREQGCTASTRSALWKRSPIGTYQVATNVALTGAVAGAATTFTLFVVVRLRSAEPKPGPGAPRETGFLLGLAGRF